MIIVNLILRCSGSRLILPSVDPIGLAGVVQFWFISRISESEIKLNLIAGLIFLNVFTFFPQTRKIILCHVFMVF